MKSTHYKHVKEQSYANALLMHTIHTMKNYAKHAKAQNTSEHSAFHYMKKITK